ncbi:hypothetical protein PROFUN_14861 [Planoprotostelium fungivorum]|uniref:Uncharacterized protein n=1 Tax=Planoprotostelium fungivorum TaxID=1890364 RepID=A0A2P6MYN4_9EUKA|nr:hypothetical protein PROFUN_14861 [Planoprotostelium fungivorum]
MRRYRRPRSSSSPHGTFRKASSYDFIDKENTGVVPIDRLSTFFQFERLPYENGWVPSQYELSGSQIFDGIKKVVKLYQEGPDVVESPIGLRLTDPGPYNNPAQVY